MGAKTADFPVSDRMTPEEAIAELTKHKWESLIGVGITDEGDFQVLNSNMSAERALWIVEWAKQWAMGLDDDDLLGDD